MALRGFYINLDRSEERRRNAESEIVKLASLGPYQRFPAVDGRRVTGWPDVKNRAELGCYLSHLSVIRQNVGCDGWLHIIEDDVAVSRFANSALSMVSSQSNFDQFDVVFHSVTIKCNLFITQVFRKHFDMNTTLSDMGGVLAVKRFSALALGQFDFYGCVSYMINPRSIGRVAELLTQSLNTEPFKPVDKVMSTLARTGELNMSCTVPYFVVPRLESESTMQEELDLWRHSQILIKHVLFADRNVRQIRRLLSELDQKAQPSVTSNLIADAHSVMIRGDLGTQDVRNPNPAA